MLNCWIAAMWLWIAARGRGWAGVTRSHAFRGLIPHFGYAERVGFRRFRSIEYRPPKGRLWSREDMFVFFRGYYLVTHFQIVSTRRWETKEQALADIYFGKRHEPGN
jgi:hypothetical protein